MRNWKAAIPLVILILFFIASTQLAERYETELLLLGKSGDGALFGFILLTALATVAAPLSSVPLIPIASHMWGPVPTALASIVGWFMGAIICFWISRRYGRAFVETFVSKEKIERIERRFMRGNVFWSIVLLRMVIPVDVLSYALGVFSIPWRVYILATALGIIPFAFVFAYLGTVDIWLQLLAFLIIAPLAYLIARERD